MEQAKEALFSDAVEWLPWSAARSILVAVGALSPTDEAGLLAEWAVRGELLTRARLLFIDGRLHRNSSVPLTVWKAARACGQCDLYKGNLECTDEGLFTGPQSVRAREIEVSAECLRNLMQFDEEDAARIREQLNAVENRSAPASAAPALGAAQKPFDPDDNPAPRRQTKPPPRWYPLLRDEFLKWHKRSEDWPVTHPDKPPPVFPAATIFRQKLIDRGVPQAALGQTNSKVRYHLAKLKKEFGRLA